MSYGTVAKQPPEVAQDRKKDNLEYRYLDGKSYVGVLHRFELVILELERQKNLVLIVAHNALIRANYVY